MTTDAKRPHLEHSTETAATDSCIRAGRGGGEGDDAVAFGDSKVNAGAAADGLNRKEQ